MSFAPGERRRKNNKDGPASWGKTLVTTAVVAYGAYRLGSWIYDTWRDDDDDDEDDKKEEAYHDAMAASSSHDEKATTTTAASNSRTWSLQRRQRMKRCRQETIQALQGFLPTLGRIIEESTSTTKETQALKKIRAQRRKKQQQEAKKQQFQSPSPQQSPTATASDASPKNSPGSDDSSVSAVTPLKESGDDDTKKKNDHDDDDDRTQEVELWNVIKIQSVTRVMATAYAHTVLFLVLTVQVHLLGAHLWKEQQQQQNAELSAAAAAVAGDDYSYQESHRYVLVHTYEYFFEHGLSLLIQTVERAVEQVLQDWNVLDAAFLHVSQDQLDEAMDKIRLAVEELNGSRSSTSADISPESGDGGMTRRRRSCPRNLLRFLMPPSTATTTTTQEGAPPDGATTDEEENSNNSNDSSHKMAAQAILDETWDLLESPVLKDAQQDCLNVTFDIMREESWGQVFYDTASSDETAPPRKTTTTTRPLAHILTKLKNTSNSFYDATAAAAGQDSSMQPILSSYCQAMEQLPSVLEVGDVSFS